MRVIMEKMVAEGIIPQGAQWMGVKVPKPLTITETFEQLKALKQIDFYTVMRVILQWKPERLLSANHVKGVVRLMNEGRLASIPNILRTIEINPADGGQVIGSNAGQTLDGIVSETARLLEEVDTDKE